MKRLLRYADHKFRQAVYFRKFAADYSKEMSRSVRAMLTAWRGDTSRPASALTSPAD